MLRKKLQSSRLEKVESREDKEDRNRPRRPDDYFLLSTAVYSLLTTLFFRLARGRCLGGRRSAFSFEKLIVYQKAVDFAEQVCAKTESFPSGYGFLVSQLNRASVSIAANIAEGNGRFTKADRKNFFGIARGSVQECVPLLELARRRRILTEQEHVALKSQLEEVSRMLSGLINGLEKRGTI